MTELLRLFLAFAKIGGFTFGGGLAMLPMMQREIVEKRGWATENELIDYYAIGQCTPGIIAVNTATFIGFKRKGLPGGIFATLGVVAPSVLIITTFPRCSGRSAGSVRRWLRWCSTQCSRSAKNRLSTSIPS